MTADTSYRAHSFVHKAKVRMDPTKLEMLQGFESTKSGFKYSPEDSNVRLIITGSSDQEKSVLIYGSQSLSEATRYLNESLEQIHDIGHDAELIDGVQVANIAVSGEFSRKLKLEELSAKLSSQEIETEYEPEQFPALIVRLSKPSATFLLFSNGKFSIQGLKKSEDISRSIERIEELIGQDES